MGSITMVALAALTAWIGVISIDAFYVISTAIILVAPLVRRLFRREFDLFEPIVLFCFTYFVLFVVRPAYILIEHVTEYSIAYEGVDFSSKFTEMQFVALVGALSAVVAYEIVASRARNGNGPDESLPEDKTGGDERNRGTESPGNLALTGVIALVIGIFGTLAFVSNLPGGFDTIFAGRSNTYQDATFEVSAYLYYAPTLLVPSSLLLLAAWFKSRNLWYLAGSVVAALLLIAVRGPVGGRLTLVPLFLGAIILTYLYWQRRPKAVTLLIVLAIGLMGWSILAQVRNESVREDAGVAATIVESLRNPQTVFEPFTEGHDAAMAPLLAAAMTVIPERLPYGYGTVFVKDFATRGIPRSLWPDKPVSPKEELTRELWPEEYASHSANPEFSVLAVFFRDLGAFGVALGMLAFGAVLAAVRNFWKVRQESMFVAVGYAVFLTNVPMMVRDSPVDSLTRLLFALGPIVVAGLVLTWTGRGRQAQAAEPQ